MVQAAMFEPVSAGKIHVYSEKYSVFRDFRGASETEGREKTDFKGQLRQIS